MSSLSSLKICRICAELHNKFYKTEGAVRKVIFELISDISDSEIIDDDRLPSSICCDCSAKLQNAKLTLDNLKRSREKLKASNIQLDSFQCRACLKAIKKNMAVNIYTVTGKIVKCLADVIREIEKENNCLQPTTFVCRSCSSMLSSFAILKSTIASSNSKFMKEILPLQDPLISVETKNEREFKILQEDEPRLKNSDDVIAKVDGRDNPVNILSNETHSTNIQSHIKKFACLQSNCELIFFTKVERDFHMKADDHLIQKVERSRKRKTDSDENEHKRLKLKNSLNLITTDGKSFNDQILCESCNRIVSLSHYENHLKSKFHNFFLEFPDHRSDKIRRQQKLTEYQILTTMKISCDVCNVRVTADYWKNHLKLKKHLFNLQNPNLRPKKRKPKTPRHNFEEDVLTEEFDDQKPKAMICDFCRKKFFKKHLLEAHLKRHVQSFKIFECYFCAQQFFTTSEMMRHRRENHTENGFYNCECGKRFEKVETFLKHKSTKNHLKYKNFEQNFSCQICEKNFKDLKALRFHYINDHDQKLAPKKLLVCHCGKKLAVNNFKAHVDNFHPTSLLCNECGKNFESLKKFRYHRDFGHLPFMTCDLCGKYRSQSKAKLWRHMRVHLVQNKKKLVCEYCGISCSYQCHLTRHLASVHGIGKSSKNERFYCDKCEKSYAERKDLANHIKYIHDGMIKQHKYFCNVCGLKFYKLNKCNKHLQSRAHMKKEAAMNEGVK